jgi:PilZ domain
VTGTAALPSKGGNARRSEHSEGVIFGRFMLADMTEHPCRVSDLSIDGVTFLTEVEVEPLAQLVAYIQDVGRVEGTVVGTVPGGIRISFQLSGTRRQRLESRLERCDRPGGSAEQQRRHHRHVARDNKSHITLPDGRVYACEVIDISLSGAALRTAVLPSLGTCLNLGKMRGRVVRYHDSGIAIEFLKLLDRTTVAAAANADL